MEKSKIVILSNSDIREDDFNELCEIGDVTVFNKTQSNIEAKERLKDATIAILDSSDVVLNADFYEALPSLRYICLNSTRFEDVDITLSRKYGVKISNVPSYATGSVAEFTMGLFICLARNIVKSILDYQNAPFEIDLAESPTGYKGMYLKGKTIGVVGMGNIGREVVNLSRKLGMNTLSIDTRMPNSSIASFWEECDCIAITASFNKNDHANTSVINESILKKMKKNVIIVNVASANFVDELAILEAVYNGRIKGYASDIPSLSFDYSKYFQNRNVLITPHVAFYTEEALREMSKVIVSNIKHFVLNKPVNLIS